MSTNHGFRMYDMKMNRGTNEKIPIMNAGIVPPTSRMICLANQNTVTSNTHETTMVNVISVFFDPNS